MKIASILCFMLLINCELFATHNLSGEISYTHLGGLNYQVNIITYTKISSNIARPYLLIYYGDGTSDSIARINGGGNGVVVAPDINQNIYEGTHLYSGTGSYIISFEDPNRNDGILNIPNSDNIPLFIEAQLIIDTTLNYNNSVRFLQMPIVNSIANAPLTHNVTAYDPDGDCLTFELVPCEESAGQQIAGYTFPNFVSIDSVNGELTWTNPANVGLYSFAVKVNEWRNGILRGYVIRDFQITILPSPLPSFYFSGNNSWQIDVNGNYSYTLYAGDSLQLNLSYTDSFAAVIDLNTYSEAFSLANPPQFLKTISTPTIASQFNWIASQSNVRSAPYIVTFRGTADNINSDLSLLIYVLDAGTTPCSFTTSVNETNKYEKEIHVFPNPFSASATVYIGKNMAVRRGQLVVYDIAGRELNRFIFTGDKINLHRNNLAAGTYLLKIESEEIQKVVRVVIE